MPTPLALTSSPLPWAVLAAAVLFALGLAVGRTGGRLVHLFGPALPPEPPDPGRATPHQDAATGGIEERAGAPDTPAASVTATVPDPDEEHDGPPPPRCPHCLTRIRFARGLPVVASRAFQRDGTCPHCALRVRPHPAVVATTALLFAAVGALSPTHLADWSPFGLLAVLWLVALGVPLSVVDLRVMRLPDALVAPAYPVAALLLAAAVLLPPFGPHLERGADALVGMALITVLYWLMWRIRPGGLGFGDVKLSGLTGLYAGWIAGPVGALVAAFWAFAAFSLLGVVLLLLRRITRAEPLPLGPFMLAATLATVLAGHPLLPQP
ncbi:MULTISPECIES: A24 family peptidase [unclassified Nocardiopsis]|jgi:leader peptidase (prepilin peptidase) / N-methyltransferase|uniref:prepilin peptidase n=1 Tax=unclassified Nocardiopsis TaxID=2649073 RepID=UPI00066A3CF7|nr:MULTISPECIES: A24 family peptidase [unclassified Nocardiopsis]MBQ1083610.1 prepilin peptidase [Nocardiopsis sp. B62]